MSYSGFSPMTRKQPRLIGQGKNLRADAIHQRIPIATGQVGATNAPVENQIAAEADICAGDV